MSYLEAEGLSDENRFAFGASHNGSLKANLRQKRPADAMDKSGDMLSYVNDSLSFGAIRLVCSSRSFSQIGWRTRISTEDGFRTEMAPA